MRPLTSILWAKGRIARHWVASVRRESKLKVAFVSLSASILWLGAFFFSRIGFRLFEEFGAELLGNGARLTLSDLIMARLLSVFALALFLMLIVSNVLVAFATVYRSREVAHQMHSPISVPTFFLGRFYECVTFSSWALAFLGSPVLLAYGLERGASSLFYVALVVFYIPFVTIPAAIGATLTILLVAVFARLRRGPVIAVGVLAVVALFAVFRSRLQAPDFSNTATVQAIIDAMGQTQSPFLPSFWLAQGILDAASGQLGESLFHLLLLLANALFFVWLATLAAEAWFYRGWTSLVGSDEGRAPSTARGLLGRLELLLRALPEPTRALVAKDIKLFWRDPAQWSQFALFFGVMALYLANLRSSDQWRDWIALLNMAACMLILATLTTRFVYPLVSLEGRRFWILGLAPLTLRRVVWQKFWLSVGSTSVFTVGLAILSGVRLELDSFTFALLMVSVAATTVALSGLAVGLGSLYPNFEEDNPARITSGMGGTLNFILSLLYIVIVTTGQAVIIHRGVLQGFLRDGRLAWVVGTILAAILLLTLVTCLVPMTLGLRHLRQVEF